MLVLAAALAPAQASGHAMPHRAVVGKPLTLTGGVDGATVYLSPMGVDNRRAAVSVGDFEGERLTFRWPQTYSYCLTPGDPATCTERPFFPGMRVLIIACTPPAVEEGPGYGISAVSCWNDFAVVRARRIPAQRVSLRHALARASWRNWGGAVARGPRGAVARDIVDCGGRLWYSTLRTRAGVRRGLAPCTAKASALQVFPARG